MFSGGCMRNTLCPICGMYGGHDSNCPVIESVEREDYIYHARYTHKHTAHKEPITAFYGESAVISTVPYQNQ